MGCCAALCRFCRQPFPHGNAPALPALSGRTQRGHQVPRRSTAQVGWNHVWVSSGCFSPHPRPKRTFAWQDSLCQELLSRTVLVKLASPISVMPKRHLKWLEWGNHHPHRRLRRLVQLREGGSSSRGLLCITGDQVTSSWWHPSFQPLYAFCWWRPPKALPERSNTTDTHTHKFEAFSN